MRKHLPLFSRLGLLSGAVIVPCGANRAHHSVHRHLEAEPGEIEFQSGSSVQEFHHNLYTDGTRHLDLVGADGQPIKVLLPWSDGKEVHVTGTENATAISKIQGNTFHDIWKQNGRTIEDVHGAVSSDGRTLTATVDARYQEDRPIHNHLTFK